MVREADAIAGLTKLLRGLPCPRGITYLTFHYLNSQAPILVPAAFNKAHFSFSGKVLGGRTTAARALDCS